MTGRVSRLVDHVRDGGMVRNLGAILAIGGAALAVAGPFVLNPFHLRILFLVMMWSGLALSWNIVGGYIRYPSFGHVAFLGLGAFTVGLGHEYLGLGDSFGLELLVTLLLAGLVPTIVAALVAFPILKLRGAYFGVTTLGIALVTFELFNNLDALGGGIGLATPTFDTPILETQHVIYYLMAIVLAALIVLLFVLERTRLGYGFAAIRGDEDAAEMIGIPTTRYKVLAFVLSAFFPGIIGGLYAYYLGFFTAGTMFSLQIGIDMIIYTIIGGIGTIAGPIVGAALMIILKHVVLSGFQEVHVLLTGALIVVVMLFYPSGIVGVVKSTLSDDRLAGYFD